jgi:hypothetical protein
MLKPLLKEMVSLPGLLFACSIAALIEPGPSQDVAVTVYVSALRTAQNTIKNSEMTIVLIRGI